MVSSPRGCFHSRGAHAIFWRSVVPGSHRDTRNPRGPYDDYTVSAPIAGDMQIVAPAGSVYIADTRIWHSTACHMKTDELRVAGVNRWTPWWFNDIYCDHGAMSGWLTKAELEALPEALQPLLRHRCPCPLTHV